ncbi:inc metabolism membrane protein [Microbotryomycetes sp. JL201]|nr:inc metabolism membrane protein [Microbotryomycetes sp. JL201]
MSGAGMRQRRPLRSTSFVSNTINDSLSRDDEDALPRDPVSRPTRPSRHRSQSMKQLSKTPTVPFISLAYPSSMLEGLELDLPKSMKSLRDLLLGKLDEAEKDVRRLQEYSEADDTMDDTTTGAESDEDEDEWELVTRRRRRQRRLQSQQDEPASETPAATPQQFDQDDLNTMRSFAQAAHDFLVALRSELPSLKYRPAMSSPVIQWELSPEAREALDKFLEDHPLPAFPQLDIRARIGDSRQRASDSASALLTRVSDELASLRDLLYKMERPSTPFASYLPSPSAKMQDLREYFAAESTRLGQRFQSLRNSTLSDNLRHLRDETADSFHAGFQKMQDGANELSAMVSSKSHLALDEAARLYHAALDISKERLLRYEELPHEWRNNPHILSGYRFVEIDRWGALLRSGFEWHNETVNIQSHLIGCLSLIYLLVWIFPNSAHYLPSAYPADRFVALLFIGAAMKCLLCSVAWHLFAGCATGHWHRGAACVDYVGISGLIAASIIGIEYYGFYCKPNIAAGYMAFSAVCGVVGMILPWKPWFNEVEYKMWRIAFFLSLAGSALTPIGHLAFLYGLKDTVVFFFPVTLSAIAYLIGLSFYAHQFPECAAPGRWDNLFASHQLWHIAIVCAVWLHWFALTTWATAVSQGTDLSCRV